MMVVGCMCNRQISRALGCSPETVAHQVARLGRHCLLVQARELARIHASRRSPSTGSRRSNGASTFRFITTSPSTSARAIFSTTPIARCDARDGCEPRQKVRRAAARAGTWPGPVTGGRGWRAGPARSHCLSESFEATTIVRIRARSGLSSATSRHRHHLFNSSARPTQSTLGGQSPRPDDPPQHGRSQTRDDCVGQAPTGVDREARHLPGVAELHEATMGEE